MTAAHPLGTNPLSISICTIASKDSSAISMRVPARAARAQSSSFVVVVVGAVVASAKFFSAA